MAGLVVGLIAAFKPEAFNGHKMQDGDALSTPGGVPSTVDKMVETLPTTATSTEKATAPAASAGPAVPAASAAPAAPLVPADLVDKPQLDIVKNTNADLLAGLLNSQSKESVSSSSSSTAQANDSISSDKQKEKGKFLQQLVQATSILGATTLQGGCMPADGMELRRMVEDPNACTIITLRPGKVYNVALEGKADDITVRSRKVIIGNPISLPTIDGTASKRIFHVVSGGSLDLQFLRTYRGSGELIATIPVLRGGTALVELGGRISAFGVVFTNAPPVGVPPFLVGADLSRAVRVFGGQIFNAGGIMTITLSHFWVLQPGVLLRELYVVGGDVLMVSGVAVFSGCTFTNSQLFLNGFGSGYQVAVLAGVLICSGVTFTVNMVGINVSQHTSLPPLKDYFLKIVHPSTPLNTVHRCRYFELPGRRRGHLLRMYVDCQRRGAVVLWERGKLWVAVCVHACIWMWQSACGLFLIAHPLIPLIHLFIFLLVITPIHRHSTIRS